MSEPVVEPADLRVSDAERSHVLRLLETATGRGLIDLGEYTERSTAVINARTRGQLNRVLLDLPGLQIAGRSVDEAAWATRGGPAGPGFSGAPEGWHGSERRTHTGPWPARSPAQVLELTDWGSRSLRGYWDAPPRIVIGGFGAATRLDFSEARVMGGRTVVVEIRSNLAGSILIIAPRGSSVALDQLSMRGVRLRNKVPPVGEGGIDLVLVGVKRLGAITVRFTRPRWGTSPP